MSRAIELVHQWTCAPLTSEEEAELGALLAAGGSESHKALELLQIEAMLRGELIDLDVAANVVTEIQRHEADNAARRMLVRIAEKTPLPQMPAQPVRQRRKPLWVALATVAATLLVVAGITWTIVRPTQPRDQLMAEGTVNIETPAGFVQYDGNGGLPLGRKIATAENGNTRVRLDDGSDVAIDSHTTLAFIREDATVRVELSEGRIVAQVARQQPGKPFAVRTPNLAVEVVGTRFSVSHEAGLSTVNVEEGTVDVVVSATGRHQRLAAGEGLTASKSGALPNQVQSEWQENFEQTELAAWWATGQRISTSEAPRGNGSQGCLKAAPERDIYYQRDLLVATMNATDGLFQCNESLVIRFRYHAAPSCGWIGIWMQAASGKKYFLPVKSTLGSWQSVELRLQETRSSEGGNDAPMPSGEVIQMLKLQAGRTADDAAFYLDDLSINRMPPATKR